jgi:hypothetical protein
MICNLPFMAVKFDRISGQPCAGSAQTETTDFDMHVAREAGNFILPAYPGLIIKDSYWRWPERNQAGNAIDFHVQILGLPFHDAMRQITGT